ncbi:ABC transporter substrate-binding protein [Sneathiella sp.]|uniref:ABC transporter substrate-binding protein n=1 Tax=Sneathiella sp. TaxID=1964365 RepID=UPI0026228196|nr:ABC transporter substrate-binding protein [Sneathiella sp.]MDF2366552.1 ABC transporter substrate-binding protein [Sneathiella sp.]
MSRYPSISSSVWQGLCLLITYVALAFPFSAQAETKTEYKSWEEVMSAAKGGTVNWFMWGGADNINQYVSDYIGGELTERYGITLKRIGINDTAEAVNIVLGEKQAGIDDKGSVDLIWINGGNFRTMKQGGLLFCGYHSLLPNNKLVNWQNPSIANDFGLAVDECEVPWNRAQFAFAYDSARTENPPKSIAELIDWVKDNPGEFTYPAATDFNGSVFIRHVFYHAAGGPDALLGDFDSKKFDAIAPKAWAILNEMKPYLWREGETYPNAIANLAQLFANREVALYFDYDPAIFGINVENGIFPETTRSYGLKDGTIGNTNYVAIPYNSPNKAAAMVAANVILSADAQREKAKADVWGAAPAIDINRLPEEEKQRFTDLPRHPAVVDPATLSKKALPELHPDWISAIEKGWQENVAK